MHNQYDRVTHPLEGPAGDPPFPQIVEEARARLRASSREARRLLALPIYPHETAADAPAHDIG